MEWLDLFWSQFVFTPTKITYKTIQEKRTRQNYVTNSVIYAAY